MMALVISLTLSCSDGETPGFNAGSPDDYPEQTVTYVPRGHFYLVHLGGGAFVALFERSPWLQQTHGDAPDDCRIRWYFGPRETTSISGNDTTTRMYPDTSPGTGDRDPIDDGFFRESCSGWVFDAEGRRLFGASSSLDRYGVTVHDGALMVDTTVRIPAGGASGTVVR